MSETITASDGTQLPLDSLAQTFTYSGALVQTISVTYPPRNASPPFTPVVYTQTFTYSGSNVTNISKWVPA